MQMHGSKFLTDIFNKAYVVLKCYAGDSILGGGLLYNSPINIKITEDNTKSFYKNYIKLADLNNEFYDI